MLFIVIPIDHAEMLCFKKYLIKIQIEISHDWTLHSVIMWFFFVLDLGVKFILCLYVDVVLIFCLVYKLFCIAKTAADEKVEETFLVFSIAFFMRRPLIGFFIKSVKATIHSRNFWSNYVGKSGKWEAYSNEFSWDVVDVLKVILMILC